MNSKKWTALFVFALIIASFPVTAQQLRGAVVGELHLSDAVSKKQSMAAFSLEDLVGIFADTDTSLMEGVEIRIEIPRGINQYRNSFSLNVYKNVSPVPTSQNNTYRGVQTFMRMLPVLDTCYLVIPFADGSGLRQDATTLLVPQPVIRDEYPLILTIQPVGKALPQGIYDHVFKISIKPIYANTGFLSINSVSNGSEKLKDVFIDGKLFTGNLSGIVLPSGMHSVLLISSLGEKSTQNVFIESGKTTTIQYSPEIREPARIQFVIPSGMDILLDGKPVVFDNDQKIIKVAPGMHQIGYTSGEFIYTRTVEINDGDSIRFTLQMDLVIEKF
jgi:hypothetical protein